MMSEAAIDEAFESFGAGDDPRARQLAFSALVTRKALPRLADDPRVQSGIARWEALLTDAGAGDEHRLLAVAELIRISQVVKKLLPRVSSALGPALRLPLPPCSTLRDADDRLNVLRACGAVRTDWLPGYLARAIAEEDSGERARAEAMALLLERVDSLAQAFSALADAFSRLRFETESPGDSMARRLVRTLSAMRPVLLSSLVEAGEGTGQAFDLWIREALRVAGRPKEEQLQLDFTKEVAATLHDLVRTRFSLSTEAETFAALRRCRALFTGAFWPQPLQAVLGLLVKDVSEALLLLGRQGVPQQALLEQLELVCGLHQRARVVAGELADQHPELPEPIRDWLRRGRIVQTQTVSASLQESLLDANDAAVGLAWLEARRLKGAEELLERLQGTLEIYEPSMADPLSAFRRQVAEAVSAIAEVAKRRGVSLIGTEGEEVEFAAKYFESATALVGTRVRVSRPAVVRTTGQVGSQEVLIKGVVGQDGTHG